MNSNSHQELRFRITQKYFVCILLCVVLLLWSTAIHAETTTDALTNEVTAETEELLELGEEDIIEDEVVVKYDNKKDFEDDLNDLAEKLEVELIVEETIDDLNIALIKTPNISGKKVEREIRKEKSVEEAEQNLRRVGTFIPNDSLFGSQWALRNTGQNLNGATGIGDKDVDIELAWEKESASATEIIVAVIDTGAEYTHADLSGNMWDGSAGCVDESNNPIVDDCPNHGWNYEDNNNDPIDSGHANTSNTGHGTFVSSVIAAQTNNSSGMSGLSRYNNIKVMALRFNFDVFSEIKAINFAQNNGAQVINASFGGSGFSSLEKAAIDAFPGAFVTAAGNGGADAIGDNNNTQRFYPCNYTSDNVICVAASNQTDTIASFSNYGTTHVDIAAPGVNLVGIYRGNYLFGNGTSFASPMVAAAAAQIYMINPSIGDLELKGALMQTVDTSTALSGVRAKGSLNMNTAMSSPLIDPIPVLPSDQNYAFRFYSKSGTSHFFTTNPAEKNSLVISYPSTTWKYEGLGFKTYNATATSVTPVYRFYSPLNRAHFYTINEAEKDDIIATYPTTVWRYENEGFYAKAAAEAGHSPVYRFYSPLNKAHFYTTSESEKDGIIATYPTTVWRYENIAFYVPDF